MAKASKSSTKKSNAKPIAQSADRYELYGLAVQHPEHEVKFFRQAYRATIGREARILREDFCGTHAVAKAWIRTDPYASAIGLDLDPEPLNWGRQTDPLTGDDASRLILLEQDVMKKCTTKADVVAAQNFSYNFFKDRTSLKNYFKAAYNGLRKDGIFVLDIFGGYECQMNGHIESRKVSYPKTGPLAKHMQHFTYRWEQESFDPISYSACYHIHFRFPDGSKMDRAFSYPWRMWTIPEVREILAEAGFSHSQVWWDTDKEDHDGYSMYAPTEQGNADAAWVAYVVGIKH